MSPFPPAFLAAVLAAILAAAAVSVAVAFAALAGETFRGPDWSGAERGRVAALASGDSLVLADGRLLRLAGIRAPQAPLGYAGEAPWRRAVEAAAALRRLAPEGAELLFLAETPSHDRHGRLRVQAATAEGGWLQPALLEAGAVQVDAEPLAASALEPLLAAEAAARGAARGLWNDPAHALWHAEAAGGAIGRFAVVEGRVLAAAEVRGTGYLNFGEDWRRDFTLRLDPPVRRAFERAGLPVESLAGRRVRARGWVFFSGGPMIALRYPEQLELLPERAAPGSSTGPPEGTDSQGRSRLGRPK